VAYPRLVELRSALPSITGFKLPPNWYWVQFGRSSAIGGRWGLEPICLNHLVEENQTGFGAWPDATVQVGLLCFALISRRLLETTRCDFEHRCSWRGGVCILLKRTMMLIGVISLPFLFVVGASSAY
jgi:hypothetical protein